MGEQATSYTPLEKDSLSSLGIETPSFNGVSTSFVATTTFIYMLLFSLIVGAAFYRYVIAGGMRMQASENAIRQSNEIIKKVTFGLLGVFSLFLILFTVNKGLVTGDVGLETLKNGDVVAVRGTGIPPIAAIPPDLPAGSPTTGRGEEAIKNDPTVRAYLKGINISVNKAVCSNPSQTGCTTVGSIPQDTLNMLSQLRNTCGGNIEVTGGTEAGHSSHGPNKYPVDIGIKDSTLNSCIQTFKAGPFLSWCNRTFVNFGYIYCDEKNTEPHWHVYK